MMTKYILMTAAVLAMVLFMACSDDAAPADCIDAAREAGVPDKVIEWMKQPHEDWGTIERIAIREALEKFGLDTLCMEIEGKLSLAESSAMDSALELAREAIKAAAAQTPPTPPIPPTPYPAPSSPNTPLPAPTAVLTRTPLPAPTAVLTRTPLPAPTAVSVSTRAPMPSPTSTRIPLRPEDDEAGSLSLFHEFPEVVEVTSSGTAGKRDSRFIIHFNKPVIATINPGSDSNRNPNSDITLYIEYPGDGTDRFIPLKTRTSPDHLSTELAFGPIEEEFAVAYNIHLTNDTAIVDGDGNHALLDFANTVFVNPGYADDIIDPALVNCVALMEIVEFSPLIVRNVKKLRSDTLTDTERIEWRLLLYDHFGSGANHLLDMPCNELWSEAITYENDNKRNHDFPCIRRLKEGDRIHGDAIELMYQPYSNLDASDRIALRIVLNAGSDVSSDCAMFYPQLFYGRWIPMERN